MCHTFKANIQINAEKIADWFAIRKGIFFLQFLASKMKTNEAIFVVVEYLKTFGSTRKTKKYDTLYDKFSDPNSLNKIVMGVSFMLEIF